MSPEEIDLVRRINRIVTRRVGALEDSHLARGRPLGEARMIFEVGPKGADIHDLRVKLSVDSDYIATPAEVLGIPRPCQMVTGGGC